MKRSYVVVCLLLLSAILWNCKKDKDKVSPANDSFTDFDRKAMLKGIADNCIVPAYLKFEHAADSFEKASAGFATNPSADILARLQQEWKNTAEAWSKCELYKIGPAANLQFEYYTSINYSPVNSGAIESLIKSAPAIDDNFVETQGASVKGLKALQYLLFNRAKGNSYILEKFTGTSDTAATRRAYLKALSVNLHQKAGGLLSSWLSSGGNYETDFINADGRDVNSSIGLLVNQLIYLTENVRNVKVGLPLGKTSGTGPQPDFVEAGESESSLLLIRGNIESLSCVFYGGAQGGNQSGFNTLLDHMGAKHNNQPLSQEIGKQLEAVNTALNAITPPLQTALTNSPQSVEVLYSELQKLLVLFKVDMTSSMGVLVTISDNDGD